MLDVSTHARSAVTARERPRPLIGPGVHIPALDGLRGLAVLAVVAYHLWPETVPGGWLGVGLFFTLSGFLVIGLVTDDLHHGGVDLPHFYRRRIRRLLPAALVTVVAVVVWVVLTDEAMRASVARDGLWAVLNLANWNQMTDAGGYAAIFEQTSRPLGHMWSLAIEEQFYLTAPLVIAWTRRPAAVVGAGLALAVIAHVAWWGTSDAYLATPVRIAEILVGGALALAVRRRPAVVAIGRLWPLAAAIGVTAVVFVEESDPVVTRGLPALISLGWVVLVAACLGGDRSYRSVLSRGWLRWLGLRSYAIYLVHWPLIELTDWSAPIVIAVTLGLAELSFRVVEDPIRRARRLRRPLLLVGIAAVVAAVLAAATVVVDDEPLLVEAGFGDELPVWFDDGPAEPPSPVEPPAPAGREAPQVSGVVEKAPRAVDALAPAPTRPPVVMVLGDSTATQIAAGLRAHADVARDLAVVDRTTSGCSALIDPLADWRLYRVSYGYLGEFSFDEPCRVPIGGDAVVPDLVVMVDHGSVMADHLRPDGTWASVLDGDLRDDLARIYRARFDEARDLGARVVLTTAPRIVDDTGLTGSMSDEDRLAAYNALVRELSDSDDAVTLFDLGAVMDEAGIEGRYARPDGLHLSLDGAIAMSEDLIAPLLLALGGAESG